MNGIDVMWSLQREVTGIKGLATGNDSPGGDLGGWQAGW